MFNLIKADLFKMRKATTVRVLFLITVICSVAMYTMAYFITKGSIGKDMQGMNFLFSDVNMMGILSAVIASIFICGDFENKTIQASVSSGINRKKLIFSKAIVVFMGIFLLLIPYMIITMVAVLGEMKFDVGSVGVSYFNVILKDGGMALSVSELSKMILVLITIAIVYIAQASICIPIALGVKKPIIVVILFYAINISSAQLIPLLKKSEIAETIISFTPLDGTYLFLSMSSTMGTIAKALVGSALFMAVMLVISYIVFKKAEIK